MFSVDKSHWAFAQGKVVGLTKNTLQRGLMAFGLSCAGDCASVTNTKQWLAGFDEGIEQAAINEKLNKESYWPEPGSMNLAQFAIAEEASRNGDYI